MRDTTPEVETFYRRLMMERSGAERLRMACEMFSTAKALARAGILAQNPNLSEREVRREIFLRFYGKDFDAPSLSKIMRALFGEEGPP